MHTRLLILGACLVSCTSAPTARNATPVSLDAPAREYRGIYLSTPDEDYFTPCGIDVTGDGWSVRFRDDEPEAPFLKNVTAVRGYGPLTHFIRVRGRISPPGNYGLGFQTRELAADTVLSVSESLGPCQGFGVPPAWSGLPSSLRDIKALALNTERHLAAVMDAKGQMGVWSTDNRALIRKLSTVERVKPVSTSSGPMVFSDDGRLLAAGGADGIVRVWSVGDGKKIFSLALKDSAAVADEMAKIPLRPGEWRPTPSSGYTPTRDVSFSRRGTMLIAKNYFSSIVWSMKTGKKLAEFDGREYFRRNVFFVADEGLITIPDTGQMAMRSYIDAEPVTRPGTHARMSQHVAFSPDRRMIALASIDSVYLWSVAEGAGPVLPVPGFITGAMSFSRDGRRLAIAGGSNGLYVFDTRTGAPLKSFHNFPGSVMQLWFSADGKSIITRSSFDDRLRVVYIDPSARPAGKPLFDDSLTARLPLGPPPSNAPRTISGTVTGPNQRAVAGADVAIINGDAPDSVIARTTTSAGGYFSFNGIRFRHVVIRVRSPGFAPGVKYIHVMRWDDQGAWNVELTPETRPAESPGGE
jgi:WD40 repeat protein